MEQISVNQSKKVGLRTDASGKFEKGLDPNNAKAAIDRACQLIEELGAGEVVGGTVDVYGKEKEPVRVPFDAEKINVMLGTDISEEEMLGYLKNRLEYDAEAKEVITPTFRHDYSDLQTLQKKLQDFTDMTIFRQHFQGESNNRKIVIQTSCGGSSQKYCRVLWIQSGNDIFF